MTLTPHLIEGRALPVAAEQPKRATEALPDPGVRITPRRPTRM